MQLTSQLKKETKTESLEKIAQIQYKSSTKTVQNHTKLYKTVQNCTKTVQKKVYGSTMHALVYIKLINHHC